MTNGEIRHRSDRDLFNSGPPAEYDNTLLAGYVKCPRYIYWFLRGFDYLHSPAYFGFGKAWGMALGTWHKLQNEPLGTSDPNTRAQLRRHLALEEAAKEWKIGPDSPVDEVNNWENLTRVFDDYIDTHGPSESWTLVGKELGFLFPIKGRKELYGGAIDGYLTWPGYGQLVAEWKTTSGYLTEGFLNQWRYSTQVTGYIWGLRELLGEMPFGCLLGATSKRKQKVKDNQFNQILVTKSAFELDTFMRDTGILIDRIKREWDTWEWPKLGERDPINCAGGLGKSKCLYRNLCSRDVYPWEVEDDYTRDYGIRTAWKPWEREGGGE